MDLSDDEHLKSKSVVENKKTESVEYSEQGKVERNSKMKISGPSELEKWLSEDEMDELEDEFEATPMVLIMHGHLENGFYEILSLQDPEVAPRYFQTTVTAFCKTTQEDLDYLHTKLYSEDVNFSEVLQRVKGFKSRCSAISAILLVNICKNFEGSCKKKNLDSCKLSLEELRGRHAFLKRNLLDMLPVAEKIIAHGGSLFEIVSPYL